MTLNNIIKATTLADPDVLLINDSRALQYWNIVFKRPKVCFFLINPFLVQLSRELNKIIKEAR